MGTETRFVDITYRGLKVAAKAKLVEQSPEVGFVELDAPLPVGTAVVLEDGGQPVRARVTGVVEQESGAKSAAGMKIAWGSALVKAQPMPQVAPEPEPEPEPEVLAELSTEPAAAEAAADAAADTSASPGGPNGKRRRRTRKTQAGRP